MAMALVEHGLLGGQFAGFTRELFQKVKKAEWEKQKMAEGLRNLTGCLSFGKEYECTMLNSLQQREDSNRSGKMCSIFFIQCFDQQGQEVSGYVDYNERLKTMDFEPIFEG